ncbi:MAG TPA: GIY-YIG nuclease family protein [Patescibacteria group bacterium]|nr:GIY-YIG nuclease family protein [Patescibacteria group bacterium]
MDIREKIKKFPDTPGVYFWSDSKGEILYIGRATSLKKRVSQYFRKDIDPRIGEMVHKAKDIKYQITDTILDSVILEANLIKKHWPKYNVQAKDDKSFIYVVIPDSDYSYPMLVRHHDLKKFPKVKNKIFGPYQNATLVKNALKIIRHIFPYGKCKLGQGKPCFDHQIGLCPGACVGEISKKDYQQNIKNISLLLSGQKKRLLKKLKKDNPDTARALTHLQDVILLANDELTSIQSINRIEGYDISHLTGKEVYGAMSVFSGGKPDKKEYRLFKIKTALGGDDLRALEEMLARRFNHLEWSRPNLVLIDGGRPQIDFVDKFFKKNNISIPMVGISKFGGDSLVFPPQTKPEIKNMTESIKMILLAVRDEAHRFGNRAGRQKRRKI